MFHDDDHDDFSSDPTSQGLLLPCPICKREVLCDLRVGRPPALLIATHPDSREAVLQPQPECPASGGRYVLVYRPGSTVH